jgi:low affinity Fe/Cu permease
MRRATDASMAAVAAWAMCGAFIDNAHAWSLVFAGFLAIWLIVLTEPR